MSGEIAPLPFVMIAYACAVIDWMGETRPETDETITSADGDRAGQ